MMGLHEEWMSRGVTHHPERGTKPNPERHGARLGVGAGVERALNSRGRHCFSRLTIGIGCRTQHPTRCCTDYRRE